MYCVYIRWREGEVDGVHRFRGCGLHTHTYRVLFPFSFFFIRVIASCKFVAMRNSFYTAALAAMTAAMGAAMSVPRAGNYPIEENSGFGNAAIGQVQKRGNFPYPPALHMKSQFNNIPATKNLGLPDDTLKTNCISIGFLPSEGDSASPRYTMAQINGALGAQSSTYGWYA